MQFLEALFRVLQQGPVALDRVDAAAELGQHGGLIAGPGADFEHLIARGHLQGLTHQPHHRRLADRLAALDGQRVILIGLLAECPGHEGFARNALNRRKDALVANTLPPKRHDEFDFPLLGLIHRRAPALLLDWFHLPDLPVFRLPFTAVSMADMVRPCVRFM